MDRPGTIMIKKIFGNKSKLLVLLIVITFMFPSIVIGEESVYEPLPKIKSPSNNLSTVQKIDLGKMLYFDPRLSGSNWISCATCHNPGLGWSDRLPRTIGDGQLELGRHSPTIINSGYFEVLMWDGRAKDLEEQALGPIQAKAEMNQDMGELIKELNAIPGYVKKFYEVYGDSGITPKNIATQIFKAMLENSASEQGSRMTAMDNATRNAGELVDKLTINYNRSRQAAITKELIEIISGAESL